MTLSKTPATDPESSHPSPVVLSDRVQEALAVTLRGCEELIPQADWVKKLVKSTRGLWVDHNM